MTGSCCVAALLVAVVCTLAGAAESATAKCIVDASTGSGAENISGTVMFSQPDDEGEVTITVKLSGFNTGATRKHGFHVHEKGDLGDACKAAGGHYNPHHKPHGAPVDVERHVGDLGNVEQDTDGKVDTVIKDKVVSLAGEYSVIGKSIVIHEGEDDLGKGTYSDSKTTGHAGARLGCCVIIVQDTGAASRLSVHAGLLLAAVTGGVWRGLSPE